MSCRSERCASYVKGKAAGQAGKARMHIIPIFNRRFGVSLICALIFGTYLLHCPRLTAQGSWSEQIMISGGDCPDFDIDRIRGNLHIVTMVNGVTYTVMDPDGVILSQETVPGSGNDQGIWTFGATISVDDYGNPHICYRDTINYRGMYYFSIFYITKDENGWSSRILISENEWRGYMVRMTVDGQDRVHIARGNAQLGTIINGRVAYYHIMNHQKEVIRDDITPYRADDRLELDATDWGEVHLVLGHPSFNGEAVTYWRSSDWGATMQLVGPIHSNACVSRNGCPDVFADQAGHVHFSYGALVDNDLNGSSSIRYVQYANGSMLRHTIVTDEDELLPWKAGDQGWGLSSVTSGEDGRVVAVAYMLRDGGALKTRFSYDSGETWGIAEHVADSCGGGNDGRVLHLIRAHNNRFYLIYPVPANAQNQKSVRLRYTSGSNDLSPRAVAGGPYVGQEGTLVIFDMSGSSDEGDDSGIVQYAWDWNVDGIYDFFSDSSRAGYAFADDYSGTAVLRVTDRGLQTDYDTTQITITNVAPEADTGPDTSAYVGKPAVFSCTIVDPGSDTHTVEWDFGDGDVVAGNPAQHVFTQFRPYTVVVTVTDDDGGVGTDTLVVQVRGYPIMQNLTVRNTDNLQLTWEEVLNATGYHVYRGNTVNFVPDYSGGSNRVGVNVQDEDPGMAGVQWTDPASVIGNDQIQFFYRVTTLAGQVESGPSERMGEFDYHLLITETTNFNEVCLVLEPYGSIPQKASDVLSSLSTCNSFAYWDAASQGYMQYLPSLTVTDFNVYIGYPYYINTTEDTIISFTGKPVETSYQLIETPTTNFNEVMLPLRMTHITTASDLAADIPGCNSVAKWNAQEQGYDQYTPQVAGTDFGVRVGYPYYVNITADVVWPDGGTPRTARIAGRSPGPGGSSAAPHAVWGILEQGQGKVQSEMVGFTARISSRPGETLDQDSPGCFLSQGTWYVQCASFPTPWAPGERLIIEFHDETFALIGSAEAVLSDEPADAAGKLMLEEKALPDRVTLLQNFPNPFNARTVVEYHIPGRTHVTIAIYDVLGRRIRCLLDDEMEAGIHEIAWEGKDDRSIKVGSGLYVLRFRAGNVLKRRKICVIQ